MTGILGPQKFFDVMEVTGLMCSAFVVWIEINNLKKKLVPGFPVFRKAFLTVNGSPFGGFEGHFTFLTTI